MYFTGFCDEAGSDIETQIKATKELGWNHIELRNIGGVNITDITDDAFERICGRLEENGIRINCFGSAIANHGKDPRSKEDFTYSKEALKRAIPRMHRLGVKMIRGMAFKAVLPADPDHGEIEKLVFGKVDELAKMCEDAGVLYVCENCGDYSGLSYAHAIRLVHAVSSPAFRLLFDMGNTVAEDNRIGEPPYARQSAWDFYRNVKDFIGYVHIKDAIIDRNGKKVHTFPGEGSADVEKIVTDLLRSGYDGGFSIEPHMRNGYDGFIEYGRRFIKMMDHIQKELH